MRIAQPEGRVAAAPMSGLGAPADRPAVGAEMRRLPQACFVDGPRTLGIFRHVERVHRAIELAHEAGLAIALTRDHRRTVGHRVDHVHRADGDADVALGAALFTNQLDHAATSSRSIREAGSARVQTSSRPPTAMWWPWA